jgi:uncharacterized membrane protein
MTVTSIMLLMIFAWPWFFTQFHELLFAPGTWSFPGDTGLIRLFPGQFWFYFSLIWSTAVLLEGMMMAATVTLLVRGHNCASACLGIWRLRRRQGPSPVRHRQ